MNDQRYKSDDRLESSNGIPESGIEDEGKGKPEYDPSSEDDELNKDQDMHDVLNKSFGYKFTEDDLIHLVPADMKTGFYIDPKTVDKNGRFRYMFCADMNGYDEVQMVKSIRNLMDSELMTNPKDGAKREAQFLDFGAHILRISRDQFEDIVTDPDKCKAWAASLGRTIEDIRTGFDGATNENSSYKKEVYPEVKQINPDSALESDLSADSSLSEVIKGSARSDINDSDYTSADGGI